MPKSDIYEIVTNRIIETLESGAIPWEKPWAGGIPKSLATGKPYRGINTMILSMAPYKSPYWLTFKQAKARGGSVRKGEKGTPIVFWKWLDKETDKGTERIPLVRYYTVFNLDQCDGIESPAGSEPREFNPIDACEEIASGYHNGPSIDHGSVGACYVPSRDAVNMPTKESFVNPPSYYATLFHELAHSTGHHSRLARDGVVNVAKFGSHAYSQEELVAEIASAFLCSRAGIEKDTHDNQAAYVASWLKVLRNDRKLLVNAAQQAQKAADRILGVSFSQDK